MVGRPAGPIIVPPPGIIIPVSRNKAAHNSSNVEFGSCRIFSNDFDEGSDLLDSIDSGGGGDDAVVDAFRS
jgi:hypothetical protein